MKITQRVRVCQRRDLGWVPPIITSRRRRQCSRGE